MSKTITEKVQEFRESTVEAILALASLLVDASFWLVWAVITKLSGRLIETLEVPAAEAWPYVIAQWCGCGVLAIFVVFRTIKDVISLYDSFIEFLKDRKKEFLKDRKKKRY